MFNGINLGRTNVARERWNTAAEVATTNNPNVFIDNDSEQIYLDGSDAKCAAKTAEIFMRKGTV